MIERSTFVSATANSCPTRTLDAIPARDPWAARVFARRRLRASLRASALKNVALQFTYGISDDHIVSKRTPVSGFVHVVLSTWPYSPAPFIVPDKIMDEGKQVLVVWGRLARIATSPSAGAAMVPPQPKRAWMTMRDRESQYSKVPAVTPMFWVLKVAATTLGETGGDAVSMSMELGYLLGTAIFAVIFLAAVVVQIKAKTFHPALYWTTIIATTTVGTTLADYADRSLGIGYAGGSLLLLVLLLASLALWYRALGSVAVDTVRSPKAELFYWITIMFSQTLGTALGDWTADNAGLGYDGAALLFGGLLAVVAAAYRWTKISHTSLFWTAFVLTRPLGAVVGDFLDKPVSAGGLALSRYTASATLIAFIVICLLLIRQKPSRAPH